MAGTCLCVTRRWCLALRHSWHVYQSSETLTLRNLDHLLCCQDAGAWCSLTTVTTTNFSTCRACGSSTVFCPAEHRSPSFQTQGRPRSCQCTLESQASIVQHNGTSGPHPSLYHECASTSSSKNCTRGSSTVLWIFWMVGTVLSMN